MHQQEHMQVILIHLLLVQTSGESESGEFELFDGGNAVNLPANYSSTSSIINVDTLSLAEQPSGDFFGYVETGMVLRGRTSGFQAKIVNKRLISDLSSDVIGSFFIPNPNRNTNPKFATGTKTFTLTDNPTNNTDTAQTLASENYVASGTLETVQETIVSVRNARVEVVAEREQIDRRVFTGTDDAGTVVTDVTQTTDKQEPDLFHHHLHHVVEEDVEEEEDGIQSHSPSWYLETQEYSLQVWIFISQIKIPMIFLLFSNLERWKMEYQLRRLYLSLK